MRQQANCETCKTAVLWKRRKKQHGKLNAGKRYVNKNNIFAELKIAFKGNKKKWKSRKKEDNKRDYRLWKKLWKLWITICSVLLSKKLCKARRKTKNVENDSAKQETDVKNTFFSNQTFWLKWQIASESAATLSKNLQVESSEYTSYYFTKKFAPQKNKNNG